MNEYQVKAQWDKEAKVWRSESDDVAGFCVEALTFKNWKNAYPILFLIC